MLRKLLKYEFRANFWLMPLLLLAVAALFGLGCAARAIGISQLTGTFAVAMFVVGFAAVIVAVVLIVTRYYKGLFGAEGYLTQTLPVGAGRLLFAKLITAFVLIVLGLAALLAGLLGMFELLGMREALVELNRQLGSVGGPLVGGALVLFLIQLVLFVSEVYFSITLSNTRAFQGNAILFAVLFYFVTQMAVGILELAGIFLIPLGVAFGASGISFRAEGMLHTILQLGPGEHELEELGGMTIGLGSVLVDVLCLVVLLAATRWLLARKTSVK